MAPKKSNDIKRAGDEAVVGFGAHEKGGSCARVCKALGCDDKTAYSLLAKHGGDHQAVIKAHNK
eukprot:CAMPEP_0115873584 /NCGR_PEP_ID=MMETSP0287-20121206/24070_1 /TAXON_ID=412157 /ORGANISM="Chrysochromulina rotalis, Strain UIO044" /LENGTH=63 /DNA_ID=CAMNT_0003328647 /DNA_START=60 /DNA_END=251 /DNA_ORIENTATION=+